jgi:hypothetical protein
MRTLRSVNVKPSSVLKSSFLTWATPNQCPLSPTMPLPLTYVSQVVHRTILHLSTKTLLLFSLSDHQLQQRDEDVDKLRSKLVAVRKLALESRELGSKSSDLALKMFDEAEL